jgi:hypothetical protein
MFYLCYLCLFAHIVLCFCFVCLYFFLFQNYRYLDLLKVLCVCDGVSIADNQRYITEVWLMKGNRVGNSVVNTNNYAVSFHLKLTFKQC